MFYREKCYRKLEELENKYPNLKTAKNDLYYIVNKSSYDYDNEEERTLDIYKTLIKFKENEI